MGLSKISKRCPKTVFRNQRNSDVSGSSSEHKAFVEPMVEPLERAQKTTSKTSSKFQPDYSRKLFFSRNLEEKKINQISFLPGISRTAGRWELKLMSVTQHHPPLQTNKKLAKSERLTFSAVSPHWPRRLTG